MTTQGLKERYTQLYNEMKASRNPSKMKIYGVALTEMFNKVATTHPDIALTTIEMLAAIEYHNYVTRDEALDVAEDFINDDTMITGNAEPTRGAHWSMDALKGFLTQRGIPLEEKPYYNWCSLWLTVNMIYSDYANVIMELTSSKENDKIATASYKMAVAKLKDRDRPSFIREYFEL